MSLSGSNIQYSKIPRVSQKAVWEKVSWLPILKSGEPGLQKFYLAIAFASQLLWYWIHGLPWRATTTWLVSVQEGWAFLHASATCSWWWTIAKRWDRYWNRFTRRWLVTRWYLRRRLRQQRRIFDLFGFTRSTRWLVDVYVRVAAKAEAILDGFMKIQELVTQKDWGERCDQYKDLLERIRNTIMGSKMPKHGLILNRI